MTYEQALEWLIDNIPIDMFDSYEDWYNACKQEIQTPALWDSPRFNRMHEDYWKNNKSFEQEEIPIPEPKEPIIEEKITITKRSDSNIVQEEKEIIRLPPTGKAPELPKPIFRQESIKEEKPKRPSIISRIRRFLRI